MIYSNYIVCGIDRLGKDTLIKNIMDRLGFYQVISFGKPQKLKKYNDNLKLYQHASFENAMVMLKCGANLIFNRSWIGEFVYADMYRGYSGNYVFELEKEYDMHLCTNTKLILLTEDFSKSKHFISDGESFDDSKRSFEQEMFLMAYDRTILPNKQLVCVTAEDGSFRSQQDILNEILK